MAGRTRGRGWRRWGAAVLAAAALGSAAAAPAGAAPSGASGRTAGGAWTVVPAADGTWTVRLRLPGQVDVRAALPQLAVDGRVLGTAAQDADGRTLRLRTTDARAASARRVELAWNGVVAGREDRAARHAAPVPLAAAAGPVLAEDPAARGPYAVQRADYDLGDTAVRLPGLDGLPAEVRAAVYLPAGAPGPRPVVVVLHGRHEPCYGGHPERATTDWPCSGGQVPVPSHLGYGQAAEALASHGYAVVSISADAVNAQDHTAPDGGAQARGELVLTHLDLLRQWTSARGVGGPAAALRGRLDLTDVGLVGHSRGGEGVVAAAAQNAARPRPYGIRAVMPLAPTDFTRTTVPGAALAVVLPYCDGDVSDQQGQHYYDDTRYAADDDALRSSLLVVGANHNYFNSEWTPGTAQAPANDDWSDDADPVCGPAAPSRLSAAQQRAVGAAYVAGFFRLQLGGEQRFLPLFDGTGGRAASAGAAVVHVQAQQPSSARTDLARLEGPAPGVSVPRGASWCAGGPAPGDRVRACAGGARSADDLPHWVPAALAPDVPSTPALRLRWTPADAARQQVTVPVPAGAGDPARALTVRVASPGGIGGVALDATLVDADGRRSTVPLVRPRTLPPLPRLAGGTSKVVLRTVRVPLSAFAGVDVRRATSLVLSPASGRGDVVLSDVALDAPAAGTGAPADLPSVSVGDVRVRETDGPQRVAVPVTLSRPSPVPVTVFLDTGADGGDARLPAVAVPVVVPAGAVTATAVVTVLGDDEVNAPVPGHVVLAAPRGAVVGDGWGEVLLGDDEA